MAIPREAIAAYLHGQFDKLETSVGRQAATDDPQGYKPDIDQAFRQLGTTETSLGTAAATDSQRDAIFALAEYYALERFWRQMGDRFEHQADDVIVKYKDQVNAVKEMMDKAAQKCAALGYAVDGRTQRKVHFQVF